MNRLYFSASMAIIIFASCNSNEIGGSKDVNPERIYFDYQVSGEEDDSAVTILLQYRFGGATGTNLILDEPSKVELDGAIIPADSSKMTGAFYELRVPQRMFIGKHSIVFTANNKKQYKEEFFFLPVSLLTDMPDTIERNELVLKLNGLETEDYVRVLLTDTSRYSEGINRIDTVRNGQITITKQNLESLANGPVNLQLIREYERPVKEATEKGGRIAISYGLRSEFVLK
jgi:hypothetical protein